MNYTLVLVNLIVLVACVTSQNITTCKALAYQGGGDRGAYQAGAIKQLVEMLPSEDLQYDFFSGISAGALNTGASILFAKNETQEWADYLIKIWEDITKEQVYEEWPIGIAGSILFEESLWNTAPLKQFLTKELSSRSDIKRKFSVGAVNANNGSYVRLTEKDLPTLDDVVNAMMASSSIPVAFPPIKFKDSVFIDGGVFTGTDIGGAINRCREIVDSDEQITIDVIMLYGDELTDVNVKGYKTLQNLWRYLGINSYTSTMQSLLYAYEEHPNVNYRYVIQPTVALPDGIVPIFFNQDDINGMIAQGKADAKAVVDKGSKVHFEETIQKAKIMRENKRKIQHPNRPSKN